MRRLVLAATVAAMLAPTGAHANAHTSLETKRSYLLGSVNHSQQCSNLCVLAFQIRPGERYLHLFVGSTLLGGAAAVDVRGPGRMTHVCNSTKAGPIDVTGFKVILIVPALYDPTCNTSNVNVTGTVAAFFSDHQMSLADAMANATPDPTRHVSGGF